MRARLSYIVYLLSSSFWFLPGLMALAAMALALITLSLDYSGGIDWSNVAWVYRPGAEGSREMLATSAGSLITVISLVFSMTLVTLTLASSQLGPRLLKAFMDDRVNQLALGTFSGTFLYHLLVLRSVHEGPQPFVPLLSLSVALFLVVASVGLLIFFIHHLAQSIQADNVIARVGGKLDKAIDAMFPGPAGAPRLPPVERSQPDFDRQGIPFTLHADGYVQAVDLDALLGLAVDRDLFIRLDRRPGDFVIAESRFGVIWPADRVDRDILRAAAASVVIGGTRTPTQDLEFSVRALVEIALRALSPGINDAFTAIACIDRLGASLARAMRRTPPVTARRDATGKARLLLDAIDFDGLLDGAFNQIRQNASHHLAVLLRLLETLAALARFIRIPGHLEAIERQGDMVAKAARDAAKDPRDSADVDRRIGVLEQALAEMRRMQPAFAD